MNKNGGKFGNAGEVNVESRPPDLRFLHELVDREISEAVLGDVDPGGVDDFLELEGLPEGPRHSLRVLQPLVVHHCRRGDDLEVGVIRALAELGW